MENKNLKPNEIKEKMEELKIELLKQPTKRKKIKREIARLLTIKLNQTEGKKK